MNTAEAKKLANAFLRDDGSQLIAKSARKAEGPELGRPVWIVAYVDPAEPDVMLTGGALAVTEDGDVHNIGSAPDDPVLHELIFSASDDVNKGDRMTKEAESTWEIPQDWAEALRSELTQPYWAGLTDFVDSERRQGDVFPPQADVFNALKLTPLAEVRVVILGQDPYHGPNQAHGLCFSVPKGVPIPPSLRKIFDEVRTDNAGPAPANGNLENWARQGVLLLNATLTVASGAPGSHAEQGWEKFTDAVIRAVNAKGKRAVFVLWGSAARAKRKLITNPIHAVVESAHPAARANAKTPFVGSRPFEQIDRLLGDRGPIDWTPGT